MNWGDLLSELRVDIEDTSEAPKFSDKLLYTYLRSAVSDYSQFLPLTREEVELTQDTENPKKFMLPADFIDDISVSCPAGRYLEPRRGRLGTKVAVSSRPLFYHTDSNRYLYLDADPGEDAVLLSYKALHPIPTSETQVDFLFTIPDANIELIKLYMEGKVNTKVRNSQARLDRFKIGSGSRTDNPMTEEVEDFFDEYRRKLAERVPSQSIILYRPRKYK
jgi:hypothetical protein